MGRLRTYLRTYRRRWHLTQEELAFLFGYFDQSIISRLEEEERAITLAVAHACELIFGVQPADLFPALFETIEGGIVQRLQELRDQLLDAKATQATATKLKLLNDALDRLTSSPEPREV